MKKDDDFVNYNQINHDPKVKQKTEPAVKMALLTILLLGFTVLYMFVKLQQMGGLIQFQAEIISQVSGTEQIEESNEASLRS